MAATHVEGPWRAGVRWLARLTILSFSLVTLALARVGVPVYVLIAAVAVSLITLYAVDSGAGRFGRWAGYLLAFVLFAHLRTLADETGIAIKGHYALEVERRLFGGALPTDWLQQRLYHAGSVGALEIFCAAVYATYFIVPHLLALVLWRKSPETFVRYGLSVLFSVYAGLVVSLAVPTAPPWLADRFAGGPEVARVVTEVLGRSPEQAGAGSSVAGTNPFAAMPSLHMALTTLVVLVLWRRRWLRGLAILYGASMAFALVYTGEHYVVDEFAGAVTAALAWVAATRLVDARARARAHRRAVVPGATTEPAGELG